MFDKMKSWKTTICGLILLITAIALFVLEEPLNAGMCLIAGIGLLAAKDSTVTGVGYNATTLSEIDKRVQEKNHAS